MLCVLLDAQRLLTKAVLIQHIIGFVQDKDFNFRYVDNLSPNKVCHRPWCTHDDVGSDVCGTFRQVVLDGVLGLNWCELPHGSNHRHNLSGQLS